ncbi:alpha-mannosidase [Lactobacillus gallinarum]|uniref:Alpha-mannosidase n=1 Tax=Lactobacillus gallinarum TaxID=52242 RepID=A0A1Y4UGD4_9LACO|nr:alpha-mannosidase [Lactobacillus gallinarum]OUQ56897.1 alpha-mannosidase [Lactobacillus gallinarum]OUQ76195.1 alpha-mannosidase [Lactobacillus gallinarum]
MAKKKVFIISHSHWDREWYMSFEEHHMRLINLMDDLIYLFKHDPDYNSFHLDGQDVIIDDYLAVRPEKRYEVIKYIKEGKLRVGPFYILQDDFLISPESNVRNMLIGRKKAQHYGHDRVPIGYFPDTFGNMGQAPQIMQLSELDTVAFGRGVTPTGFNNKVAHGDFDSTYSEMWWQSPNQDKVLAILFANWYSNGNEIPVDREAAKKYWTQKLADAERFAATPDLLFMNGVDHQPPQMDVTKAIKVANELFPDYKFIHSNFEDYVKQLKQDLPKDLSTVKGELTSQDTDGWYTLANTASSRIYLKQTNTKMERLIENKVEPIFLLNKKISQSDQDKLDYAWEELLRNNPHDSITGCSVDSVHRGMMNRFAKVGQVGRSLCKTALSQFGTRIDTSSLPKQAKSFVVINPSGVVRNQEKTVTVEVHRCLFAETTPQKAYEDCEAYLKQCPNYQLFDAEGRKLPYRIEKKYVHFGYKLPERTFRVPYMAAYVELTFAPTLKPFSWSSFYLMHADADLSRAVTVEKNNSVISNQYVKAQVTANGQLKIFDQYGTQSTTMNLVDTGDIGNEYIYKQSADGKEIVFDSQITDVQVKQILNGQKLSFVQKVMLPKSADEKLKQEEEAVIDITHRTAKRSSELTEFTVKVELTLMDAWHHVAIKITGDNQVKDHRLQAVFDTGLNVATNDSDSIFEVVTRPNQVSKNWQNPENPQHEQAFVSLHDQDRGVVIGNYGLNEYQTNAVGSTIAITLLRCIGELGDWGYFPTHDSQCQGKFEAKLSVYPTDGSETEQVAAYQNAKASQIELVTKELKWQKGTEKLANTFLQVSNSAFQITATYVTPDGKFLVRGYNLTHEQQAVMVKLFGQKAKAIVDLLGKKLTDNVDLKLKPAEIRTYEF